MVRYLAPRLLTLALIVGLLTAAGGRGPIRFSSVSAQTEATPEAPAPTGGVEIVLTAADGSRLAGGCFAATDAAGATLTGCDDDGDGVTRIDGLAAGTAAVVETTVPAGFTGAPDSTAQIVPGETASIGFSNAPVVTPEPSPSPTVEPSPTALPTDTPTPDAPATNESQSLAEAPTGQLAVTSVEETGGPLFYTCFKVYLDAGGGERGALVAGGCDQDDGQKDGRLIFDGLAAASYLLVQISAPANYTRAGETPFAIVAGETTSLTIQDQPGGMLIVATVDDGGQPLPGACYRAYVALGSGTRGAYVGSGCDGSNADGVATIRSLPFGAYVLGQSVAPSGYAVAPDQTFSITDRSEVRVTVRQSLPGILAISTVDPDLQTPVAGACFRVYRDAGGGVRGSQVASGCDGDDGSADGARSFAGLTPGPYVLTESSAPSGYAPALNRLVSIAAAQTTAVTLENRAVSELVVAAVGDQQEPLAGSCYKVYIDNGSGKRGTYVATRCDGDDGAVDGTTHILGLPPTSYVLVDFIPPTGYAAVADQPFATIAGQMKTLTIEHQPGGEAAVSLLDPMDSLLPGACFTAYRHIGGPIVAARCDKDDGASDGRTTMVGLAPGAYFIGETTVPSGVAVAPSQPFSIVAGQVTPVVFKSTAGGAVFVTQVDEASRPISGGCVTVRAGFQQVIRADGSWASGCDGDDHHLDGKIAIRGLSVGSYVLDDTQPSVGYLPAPGQSFSITGGTDVSLTVPHQLGGSVAVMVLDEHQQPLPGACFSVDFDAGGGKPGANVSGAGSNACDMYDGANDGTVTLLGLRTGNYVLVEYRIPPGYLRITQPVSVVAGQVTAVTVESQIAGRATVTVVDEQNAPVVGACFGIYTDAGGGVRGSRYGDSICDGSDGAGDGVTSVDHLPSGSYILTQNSWIRWHLIPDQPFTVEAGSDTPITIQSPTGGQVIVTTLDANGARIYGLCYDLYDYFYVAGDGGYSTYMATACDADDGLDGVTTFRAAPHAPHKYSLRMVHETSWYWMAQPWDFNLSPRQTIRITVQEGVRPPVP
jgi:uncharacterized surface anchored protein